ncbi:Telomeric repeat-binding factor 2 TTAGGG repeat-binding factor 2 [Takifugu flavidus]|uniref:Telomeric repeat-binding factor n=1 Tax=Takifugu flavidus TaxID=433684 RepID=A0A5C6NP29_9TELE|nr:Telomeric repeat-binding factor 2 TTAGGG repeat-binding factor 2 [Takifugu flavidus]
MNMAAKEVIISRQSDIERVVNRWLLDYYFSLGLQFFQRDQREDFLDIVHVFEGILKRPYEVTSHTRIQIRLLQLLDQVNDGRSSAASFEQNNCLETVLSLLEALNKDFIIQQEDYNSVHASLRDLIVVILVKDGMFKKAEEMIKKHFPRPMVGNVSLPSYHHHHFSYQYLVAKRKAIFMGLIKMKSKSHPVIDQVDFQHFMQEIVVFCQKICPLRLPFLCKAAAVCIDKRLANSGDNAGDLDEVCEPGPSSNPQQNTSALFAPCDLSIVTISRLEAVYRSLVTGLHDKTFTQVKMEATKEDLSLGLQKCTNQDADQDVPYQGASSSPMEASPADEPTQIDADPQIQTGSSSKTASVQKGRRRRLYTVAQLVVEPDSQGSSQCTPAFEEVEPVAGAEELPPAAVAPSGAEPQSPEIEHKFDAPTRIRYGSRRKHLFNNATESKETWEEDSFNIGKDGSESTNENSPMSGQRRRMWTEAETQKLIEGVRKFGVGNWSKIRAYYSFNDRTNVNLKDRWRTLKKTNMV